ncbi:MAG: HAMP domain-containing histidine kinase [Eubacterium sp.]|nr:HAMP domain-containing histidine kinase [Eubacterium sp.]
MKESRNNRNNDIYAAAGDKKIIRRLRIKFCAIMMTIVIAFLAVIYTVQYISNKRTFETESENALNMAIETTGRGNGFRPDGRDQDGQKPGGQKPDDYFDPDDDPEDIKDGFEDFADDMFNGDYIPDFRDRKAMDGFSTTPVMCVILDSSNEITVVRNDIFFIENEDADTLVSAALKDGRNKGVLDDYSIRFMKKTLDNGNTAIAFADISSSQSFLKKQLMKSIWISLAVASVLFVLSLFVSKWAVKPVERALKNQKRFIADASHELKTPLAVIISNTDMVMKSDQLNDKNKRRLDNISAESARMKQLVQELIDLARGDASEGEVVFEDVDLSSVISDDILSWEPVAYDAGRTLADDITEDIHVKGNRDKLKQIADILIDNAIKYSNKGSEITVKLRKKDKRAALYVKNAGKALTEEEKVRIFDRFYRADESRESTVGYGLGLSIAIQLAELHKGRLYVETEVDDKDDEFNIFKLELPM